MHLERTYFYEKLLYLKELVSKGVIVVFILLNFTIEILCISFYDFWKLNKIEGIIFKRFVSLKATLHLIISRVGVIK